MERRHFIVASGAGLLGASLLTSVGGLIVPSNALAAASGLAPSPPKPPGSNLTKPIELIPTADTSEAQAAVPFSPLPPAERVGFAVVGLGHLSLEQILPAFAKSLLCKPVALVSGHRPKAEQVANQYGIDKSAIYNYDDFSRIRENKDVKVIYVVLPNSLHKEFVFKSAAAAKHILCEKPMATSSADAQAMVDVCRKSNVKLMIAYRQHFEPNNQALREIIQNKTYGKIQLFQADNSQRQGDRNQWRLKKALAGGGPLPDVGIYCINAARFISGEEPEEVQGWTETLPHDPRFKEVESSVGWQMRFPSGFLASCTASYAAHRHQQYSFMTERATLSLNPAFGYHGNKIELNLVDNGIEQRVTPTIDERDQFASEMDHMAECVLRNKIPSCPGEEGVRDMKIIEAIYASAQSKRAVKLS